MSEFVFFFAAILFVLFFIIRNQSSEHSFLLPILGKFAWIPWVGNYIQALASRDELDDKAAERAALSLQEQRNKARNHRKLLRRVEAGDKQPLTSTPKHEYKTQTTVNGDGIELERAIKQAIAMSTSSHNRVSNAAPPTNLSTKSLRELQYFAYKFQSEEKYREPFILERMDDVTKTKQEISLSEFATELRSIRASTSISFLYGSIGSGKSTAAAIMEGEIYTQMRRLKQTVPIDIVALDFEEVVHDLRTMAPKKNREVFVDYLFERLKRTNGGQIKEDSLEAHLNSSTQKKYVFILDNLDVVYSEFCRYFVANKDLKLSFFGHDSYLYCLRELIRVFSDLPTFASPTAPSVLLCLREDTIALLNALYMKTGLPQLSMRYNVVRLVEATSPQDHFVNLITKRLILAEDMINSPGIPDDIGNAMATVRDALELDPTAFAEFVRLSVQGNRSATQAFQRYFLADADTHEIAAALSDIQRVRSLALFNGHELYSQERSNIANLFLVNSEYRIWADYPDLPVDLDLPSYFHEHTFWLKYLVFAFISHQNEKAGSADLTEIENTFCDLGGFDRRLVRLVVYSLTEVQHGRLVRPRVNHDQLNARFLHMTSRGHEFAKDRFDVVWSLPYLATVIEDEWIELPKFLAEKREVFGSKAFWKVDDYKDYLLDKVGAVTEFVTCLAYSLKLERERRPHLFSALHSSGVLDSCIPDFGDIIDALQLEARNAAGTLGDTDFEAKISSAILELRSNRSDTLVQIKEQLKPLYDYQEFQAEIPSPQVPKEQD